MRAPGVAAAPLDLDYSRTTLANGLVVVVHEDALAPEVSLSVCYRVGSKDEGPGQTGSAHLFEHLMFTGTINVPGNFGKYLTDAGATLINAYTAPDHTCFFSKFPAGLLDYVLYAEADRMGSFREALTAEALAQQQAIVLEEKAQREGAPMGMMHHVVGRALFPVDHPYRHTVIGSMEDIAGMTLESARAWHRRFYTPVNAALIIAGPIDREQALARAEAHFGHISPGTSLRGMAAWVPALPQKRRERITGQVSGGGMLHLYWPVAEATHGDAVLLSLFAALIGGDEHAPLQRGLIDSGLGLFASASMAPAALCSQFSVAVLLTEWADDESVYEEVRRLIGTVLMATPDDASFNRLRLSRTAAISASLAHLQSKVQLLLAGEMLARDPAHFRKEGEILKSATMLGVYATARRWLSGAPIAVTVVQPDAPPAATASRPRPDRPQVVLTPALVDDPSGEKTVTRTGLQIVSGPRPAAGDFFLKLTLPRGAASESDENRGATSLLCAMPFHGAGTRGPAELRRFVEEYGISLSLNATASRFEIMLAGAASSATHAALLMRDFVLSPRFDATVLGERRQEQIRALQAVRASPAARARSFDAERLYGQDNAETRASGTVEAYEAMTVALLAAFHRRLFVPDSARLTMVADQHVIETMQRDLEPLLSEWHAVEGALPELNVPALPRRGEERLYYASDGPPDQALVSANLLLMPFEDARQEAVGRALAFILQLRLNSRLRETLQWTYGVQVMTIEPELDSLPSRLQLHSAIGAMHAGEAIHEIRAIVVALAGDNPPTRVELAEYRQQARSGLLGSVSSTSGVAIAIEKSLNASRPASISQRIGFLDAIDVDDPARLLSASLRAGPLEWTVISANAQLLEALTTAHLSMAIDRMPDA